jgi:hypothetical protein
LAWFKTIGGGSAKPMGVKTLAGPELRNHSQSLKNVVRVKRPCDQIDVVNHRNSRCNIIYLPQKLVKVEF